MARDYRERGGFKEIAETIGKLKAEDISDVFSPSLLEKGREAEEKFAQACEHLAGAYQELLSIVERISKCSRDFKLGKRTENSS